jgi:GTP-binding protein
VFLVSAATHEGLRELSFALGDLVNAAREKKAAVPAKPRITLMQEKRPEGHFTITKENFDGEPMYRIVGVKPERWVAQTQFGNEEAVGYLGDRLAKIGIEDALFKAGAVAGSMVVIGAGKQGVIFDWEPTIASAAELITGPRGTDLRIDQNDRRTTPQRRREYKELMDAKTRLRAEMEAEGKAGFWRGDDDLEEPVQKA